MPIAALTRVVDYLPITARAHALPGRIRWRLDFRWWRRLTPAGDDGSTIGCRAALRRNDGNRQVILRSADDVIMASQQPRKDAAKRARIGSTDHVGQCSRLLVVKFEGGLERTQNVVQACALRDHLYGGCVAGNANLGIGRARKTETDDQ